LTNGLKFSHQNSRIKIKLRILKFQDKPNTILLGEKDYKEYFISFLIIVKDYGIGIPAD
jgi:signal transduction histidine kinase